MDTINPIHKAPYTNFHDLNLDWIIEVLNEFNTKLTDFVSLATIKYADPIQWDITSQYEANTVVVDSNGNAYLSVRPVPSGVSLDRTEFWTKIGNFDELWADVKRAITPNDEGHSPTATADRAVNDLVWVNGSLVRVTKAMTAGDAYVPGSNCVSSSTNEVLHYLITAFNEGLRAEQTAREDADRNLQTAIDTEKQTREDADSDLQTALDTENRPGRMPTETFRQPSTMRNRPGRMPTHSCKITSIKCKHMFRRREQVLKQTIRAQQHKIHRRYKSCWMPEKQYIFQAERIICRQPYI